MRRSSGCSTKRCLRATGAVRKNSGECLMTSSIGMQRKRRGDIPTHQLEKFIERNAVAYADDVARLGNSNIRQQVSSSRRGGQLSGGALAHIRADNHIID